MSSFKKVCTTVNEDNLVSAISDLLDSITKVEKEVQIPSLLEHSCDNYEVKPILNTARHLRAALIGRNSSRVVNANYDVENSNSQMVTGNKKADEILHQMDDLKKLLRNFQDELDDMVRKYEISVNELTNKNTSNLANNNS